MQEEGTSEALLSEIRKILDAIDNARNFHFPTHTKIHISHADVELLAITMKGPLGRIPISTSRPQWAAAAFDAIYEALTDGFVAQRIFHPNNHSPSSEEAADYASLLLALTSAKKVLHNSAYPEKYQSESQCFWQDECLGACLASRLQDNSESEIIFQGLVQKILRGKNSAEIRLILDGLITETCDWYKRKHIFSKLN